MSERLPLRLELPAHLADHRYRGAAVLPAVEALQALARVAGERRPGLEVARSSSASFMRFMPVAPGQGPVEVVAELEPLDDGGVRAALLSVKQAGRSGITRSVEHVEVTFDGPRAGCEPTPVARDGAPFEVSRDRLYGELVPFGPAYHNVRGPVELWPEGAAGDVVAPDLPGGDGPLGSPFPFDAALHVACAWGQRHLGLVLFPTGYASRSILCPTEPGGEYRCEVRPLPCDTPAFSRFDIALYDAAGRDAGGQVDRGALCELCTGVRMEDISRGRLQPPGWVLP